MRVGDDAGKEVAEERLKGGWRVRRGGFAVVD